MDRKITIFKNILDTKNPYHIPVCKIVERIKTGKVKKLIESIRNEDDKKKRNKLKSQLPSICFSGIFSQRSNKDIKEHTGLVAIDFDGLKDYDLFKESIIYIGSPGFTLQVKNIKNKG